MTLICKYCGQEIHKSGGFFRTMMRPIDTISTDEQIMPDPSEDFPFHDRWVYQKLK
jgi:hypothetical protein